VAKYGGWVVTKFLTLLNMTQEIILLAGTATALGFIHTLFGPDHYLPFIVMAKARKWTMVKTLWITALCGLGHVGSTIILGIIGISSGLLLSKIEFIDGYRGSIAAWAFIAFGLIYMIWGIYRAIKNKPHKHIHFHANGKRHTHLHKHEQKHAHTHDKNITPWVLFTIFVFGPCEPLIPLLMFPAIENSLSGLIFVISVFSVITIGTMITIVVIASYGINLIPLGKIEKYTHAIAGFVILLSGIAIEFLGL